MSRINVKLEVSQSARSEYAVRTGNAYKDIDQYMLDLQAMDPEQRKIVLAVLVLPSYEGEIRYMGQYTHFVADRVPESAEGWVAIAEAYATHLVLVNAERAAQEQAVKTRKAGRIAEWQEKILALEPADDAALLVHYDKGHGYFLSPPEGRPEEWIPRQEALIKRARKLFEAQQEAENAQKHAAQGAKEADRLSWIAEHGSAFLKKAVGAGYDCQRRYVGERAAIEHPTAIVDFDDNGEWKSRSCPSEEALDLALKLGGEVVWLTRLSHGKDDDGWDFDPCQAVVVRKYLGKYDVIYTF